MTAGKSVVHMQQVNGSIRLYVIKLSPYGQIMLTYPPNPAIMFSAVCYQSSDIGRAPVAFTPHNNTRSIHICEFCFVKYTFILSAHSPLCIVRGKSDRATDF
jgi:hypothetical protein